MSLPPQESDILCKEQLVDAAAEHPEMFRALYTLTSADPPPGWAGAVGRISPAMIDWVLSWGAVWPSPSASVCVPATRRVALLCGPQGMMDAAQALLIASGVAPADIIALDA